MSPLLWNAPPALVQPCAGHRRDGQRRVHVHRPVALPAEAVAQAEVGARRGPDHPGEALDGVRRHPGDAFRPLRGPVREVALQVVRTVGVAGEVVAVRVAVAEEHVHHRAGERAVGAGTHAHEEIGLLRGRVAVGVDDDDGGAAPAPGLQCVRHHVDLGRRGVGAPDDHEVGLRHLARVGAREASGARDEAVPGERDADGGVLAGVALDVAQAVDAVAHHEPHGAGVVVGPDRLGAVALLGLQQRLGHDVERVVPGHRREALSRALLPDAAQRRGQAVGVMDAFGVARDLAADDAGGIGVLARPAHLSDEAVAEAFDLQRAGRGTVVGTGAVSNLRLRGHRRCSLGLSPGSVPSRRTAR